MQRSINKTLLLTAAAGDWMSAWSRVRVHELGLKSSHINAQRKGQRGKVVLHQYPRWPTHSQTSLTQCILSVAAWRFCWQRHTLKKSKWRGGGGGDDRRAGGRTRRGDVRRCGSRLRFYRDVRRSLRSRSVFVSLSFGRQQKKRQQKVLKLSRQKHRPRGNEAA